MFVSIHENWLNNTFFQKYIDLVNNTPSEKWGVRSNSNVWAGRVIYNNSFDGYQLLNNKFISKIHDTIKSDFQLNKEIYPDYLGLVKWEKDDYQSPHADGEEVDRQHIYHWRNFGCVYYLNDDYEGGEIYFPNQDIFLKPKPNTLVFFPGTLEFLHGVKIITSGVRYTLTSFWTYDINHKIV